MSDYFADSYSVSLARNDIPCGESDIGLGSFICLHSHNRLGQCIKQELKRINLFLNRHSYVFSYIQIQGFGINKWKSKRRKIQVNDQVLLGNHPAVTRYARFSNRP